MSFALITGPTSGIGLELAHILAENEHNLILVSRDKKKLQALAQQLKKEYKVKVEVIVEDLSKAHSAQKVFTTVQKKKWKVDVLINNAGFGTNGHLRDLPVDRELAMIQLNVVTLVEMTKLFLDSLIKNNGRILNVASVAAFQPIPTMANYAATKSYVLSFSEALDNELEGTGASVTALCPGATKTHFAQVAQVKNKKVFDNGMEARDVAEQAYDAMMDRRTTIITGVSNKVGAGLAKVLPGTVSASVVKSIFLNK